MAVSSELHFSPEITPHRISKRVNPPNLGEEFTALFKEDGLVDRSFQPLLTVFERIAQEGISIAPIEVDPNYYLFDPVEFLIAPLKSVEGGVDLKQLR